MFHFNIVISNPAGDNKQLDVVASTWQAAIDFAKTECAVDVGRQSDDRLVIVQRVGKVDVVGT